MVFESPLAEPKVLGLLPSCQLAAGYHPADLLLFLHAA